MEEVGQGHGGEGCEDVRTVQRVVDALGAPPLGCDCRSEREVRTEWPAQGLDPKGRLGPRALDPGVDVPLGAQVWGQSTRLKMSSGKCAAPPPPWTSPSPLAGPPLLQDTCCKQVLRVGAAPTETCSVSPQDYWSAGSPGRTECWIRALAEVRAQSSPDKVLAQSKVRGQGPCPGSEVKVFSEVRAQSGFPLPLLLCPQQPRQWTSRKPQDGPSPKNPGRAQETLTHCGRRPRGPGCQRTPSFRCGSCLGSSSAPDAGTSGPEGARWGHPEVGGCPGSCPPGRGSCGCAGHQLEGEVHSQGRVGALKWSCLCCASPVPGRGLGTQGGAGLACSLTCPAGSPYLPPPQPDGTASPQCTSNFPTIKPTPSGAAKGASGMLLPKAPAKVKGDT